ncbi:putative fatty acyl-CoA reductase CG5065 [Neocloeon triangulifer]|uniref:putative fatty acyl-CoA reductase CG5065 n=1 Tax=Neocloeon triangulifer TaxID=2078957 RepID=UPI00286F0EBA|nr:putative fatty acyl-CoA reductase CG5065 [Neocloeon triangulifer]XP_059487924.1 putative fatty acyl-CoA reductase CG5065 [Neocloeon triangulifer]XP_059487925.1 putative fatty acyl-CoA reductase CG5065 [Neocloeon triangulifer]XP_059487926.1 putative fatty acyl-CoA reductase CG5065 [Neocloeon triangulifer]XP_059487927.1 putative fatty acyl-CoA reductase CG5065 [Neocloeon triangulifer]
MATSGGCSQIAGFYKGRCVLITGATGFMGKVLVEKLLRSCPEIKSLYLLMRPKRGHDVRARLAELLNAQIFDGLRKEQPDALSKLIVVAGDITQPELGISAADQRLLTENVSVVFHSAATVKFDEALKLSVAMNILGTKRLVELCHKMGKLEALVHVSTAYCNCDRDEVQEQVYDPPADPDKIIQCVEWMDEDLINAITPKLIGNRPNTYTFTKALAEHVLVRESGNLPVAIVRPSIVTAAWKDPISGWVDNLNGPTGMIAGAGKGVLRTILCYRDLVADLVPVDICINLMISVAWNTAVHRPRDMLVYNCTSGSLNPIKWHQVEKYGYHYLIEHPFSDVIWYPNGSFKSNRFVNNLSVLAFHMAPALVLDTIARISGKKPIMMRVQQKLSRAVACLEFFTTHEWRFTNHNVTQLAGQLCPLDQQTFNFDIKGVNWAQYMENYVLGTRRFILKEDPSNFPAAHKHLRKMWWVHQLTQVLTLAVVWRVVLLRSSTARRLWFSLMSLLMRLVRATPLARLAP